MSSKQQQLCVCGLGESHFLHRLMMTQAGKAVNEQDTVTIIIVECVTHFECFGVKF